MKGVFWHALVFGLSPVLQKLVGLILVPLYSHYLTPRDYGEIELLTMVTGLFGMVLRLELRAGYMRAWIQAPDEHARGVLLIGVSRLLLVLGLAGGAAFMFASGPLCDAVLGYRIGWTYAALLAVGIVVDVVSLAFHATLQAQLRSGLMVTLGVAQFSINAVVTVICVTYLGTGPIGVFIGGGIASLLVVIAMAVTCLRSCRTLKADWGNVYAIIQYSAPLLVSAMLFFVVRNADRFAVSRFLSVKDLGLYAMAWVPANVVMTTVFVPIQTSLDVWRYRFFAQDGGAARFADVYRMAMAVIGIATIGVATLGADLFGILIDPAFASAMAYVPLLGAAVMVQAAYSIVASAFYVTGATGVWTVIFGLGAATQVVVSLSLIPLFGIAGAAGAIILANLVLYAGAAYRGRRLWRVDHPHLAVLAAVAAVPALAYVRTALPPLGLLGAFAVDVAAIGAYFAVLAQVGLLVRQDATTAIEIIQARVGAVRRRLYAAQGAPPDVR